MLSPGTSFDGYTILDRLHTGGMADIFVAHNLAGKRVVLRVLRAQHQLHWRGRRQFHWGCEVLSKLDHPNVVKIYATGKFRGRLYAVLEWVDGANLKERMVRQDPTLPAHQRQVISGMAAGLAHIHERGFLHLDFKPENVVVSHQYEAKLVDLDLARTRPDKPRKVRLLAGTPAYLAPEQIRGEPVDERADIFAFGLTTYELVTGHKPVTGNSREELLHKYAAFNHFFRPPRVYVPDIAPALEQVIVKCLEKDIDRRYPSMQLVLRDLLK